MAVEAYLQTEMEIALKEEAHIVLCSASELGLLDF